MITKPRLAFREAAILSLAFFVWSAGPRLLRAAAPTDTGYEIIRSHSMSAGGEPSALFEGSDGRLYGASDHFEGMVFRLNRDGGGFELLHSYGRDKLGEHAPQGLIEGSDGKLYGTTRYGGLKTGGYGQIGFPGFGNGTVFSLTRDGTGYRVLHQFTGTEGDGWQPWAGVVEGPDGALYGTTLNSGHMVDGVLIQGGGVIYKLNKEGSGYQVLHRFHSVPDDGGRPFASLLSASDGQLYGVTDGGGKSDSRNGTVFRISPDGNDYAILHSFPGFRFDGRMPRSQLVEGPDGMLYGTTTGGGSNDFGTVFRLGKDGTGYQVFHEFEGQGDSVDDPAGRMEGDRDGIPRRFYLTGKGSLPMALVQAADGTLFGSTHEMGRNGAGSLYQVNPDGTGFKVVHYFNASDEDGRGVNGPLTVGSDGNIYGATTWGGQNDLGTVFRVVIPSQ